MTTGGNTRYDPNDPELDGTTRPMTPEQRIAFLREQIAINQNWVRYYGIASPLAAANAQALVDKLQAELDAASLAAEVSQWANDQDAHDEWYGFRPDDVGFGPGGRPV